jgi:cytochrome c-type biogenesis protein CcmE
VAWARKTGIRILIATSASSALILGIVFGTSREPLIYSLSVKEALLRQPSEQPLRVQGILRRGSLCAVKNACEFRLVLDGSGAPSPDALDVRYAHCTIPESLTYDVPGIDVVMNAEGTLEPNHQFQATALFAKCPAKYWYRDASTPSRFGRIPICH